MKINRDMDINEILVNLEAIKEKIHLNTDGAWQDDLENKINVVILQDISNGLDQDDDRYDVEYNGWLQDIYELINQLKTK